MDSGVVTSRHSNVNYSEAELRQLFGSVGRNVTVSRSTALFSPENIHIGSNVRIDCFCLLSAGPSGIRIGDYVHLAAGVYIFGFSDNVEIGSFCGLSSRVTLYTSTDDYTDGFLSNPTVPSRYKRIRAGKVSLQDHALLGAGTVVMPGITIGVAASIGALSFVNSSVPNFAIGAGNPLRFIGERPHSIRDLEREFLASVTDPSS